MNDDPEVSPEQEWPPSPWQPVVIGAPRPDDDVFRWPAAPQDY
jgi:hypothetical protein